MCRKKFTFYNKLKISFFYFFFKRAMSIIDFDQRMQVLDFQCVFVRIVLCTGY